MRLQLRPLKEGDLSDAIALIDKSWSAQFGDEGYLTYSGELLRYQLLELKGSVFIGAFRGKKMVGLNASLPGWFMVNGRLVSGGIPTYLSVDPQEQRAGLGRMLIEAVVETHRERGDSILLPFFEADGPGLPAYRKTFPDMQEMYRGRWMARLLSPDRFWENVGRDMVLRQMTGLGSGKPGSGATTRKGTEPGDGSGHALKRKSLLEKASAPLAWDPPEKGPDYRPADADDARTLRKVLNTTASGLSRHWNAASVKELLGDPACTVIVGVDQGTGDIVSALPYNERTLMSKGPMKVAWFDPYAGPKERRLDTIQAALRSAKDSGCATAMWLDMGLVPSTTMLRAGFLPFPRRLVMGAIGLNGFEPRPTDSYQLEVR